MKFSIDVHTSFMNSPKAAGIFWGVFGALMVIIVLLIWKFVHRPRAGS
jgi:hypothetical protein